MVFIVCNKLGPAFMHRVHVLAPTVHGTLSTYRLCRVEEKEISAACYAPKQQSRAMDQHPNSSCHFCPEQSQTQHLRSHSPKCYTQLSLPRIPQVEAPTNPLSQPHLQLPSKPDGPMIFVILGSHNNPAQQQPLWMKAPH